MQDAEFTRPIYIRHPSTEKLLVWPSHRPFGKETPERAQLHLPYFARCGREGKRREPQECGDKMLHQLLEPKWRHIYTCPVGTISWPTCGWCSGGIQLKRSPHKKPAYRALSGTTWKHLEASGVSAGIQKTRKAIKGGMGGPRMNHI